MENKELIGRKVTIKDSGSHKQHKVVAFDYRGRAVLADENNDVTIPAIAVERLEVLPLPDHAGPKGYMSVGSFKCTPDEATEWFVFLMLQAADIFTNIPPDSRGEVLRLLTVRGEHDTGPCVVGALAYYDAANEWYNRDAVVL